ncbi:G-protein coupled receptor Mth2-like [Neocloeon triangulifer]|uniref:G-protein coupled receptor Mth2-like n=1 Tax=Neocloeon triangulifer TaxID=2078957 RepID=UPI00286F2386|nr:G-protein coupled receptor Mth2-like [Neocloeon triangulifer]
MRAAGQVIFIFLIFWRSCLVFGIEPCDKLQRTKINFGTVQSDGKLEAFDGIKYPEGTFWREGEYWWACPCLLGPCIRLCEKDLALRANSTEAKQPFTIKIQGVDGLSHSVLIKDHFNVVEEAFCQHIAVLLDDDEKYHIYPNGSLYYPPVNNADVSDIIQTSEFCLIPQEAQREKIVLCSNDADAEEPEEMKFNILPAFFILSAIFLLLTIVAFCIAPGNNSAYSRSVVCHSGCLLIAFAGLTITYLSGEKSHIYVCKFVAFVTYLFMMASFFWLNVMCIDIYLASKGIVLQAHDGKFRALSTYAWGTALAIFIVTLILDLTTRTPLSPGIGVHNCWFQGFWPILLYFNGPIFILLVVNLCLFLLAATRLRFFRKEAGPVQIMDSQEKNQLRLYAKIFILMGGTWFFEIISWACHGKGVFWLILDSINALRGVLIFLICVVCNEPMRGALKEKLCMSKNSHGTIGYKPQPT